MSSFFMEFIKLLHVCNHVSSNLEHLQSPSFFKYSLSPFLYLFFWNFHSVHVYLCDGSYNLRFCSLFFMLFYSSDSQISVVLSSRSFSLLPAQICVWNPLSFHFRFLDILALEFRFGFFLLGFLPLYFMFKHHFLDFIHIFFSTLSIFTKVVLLFVIRSFSETVSVDLFLSFQWVTLYCCFISIMIFVEN